MTIKKLPGGHNPIRQKIMNSQSTSRTERAKSGKAAEDFAFLRDQDKNTNPKVKKINTNPTRTSGLQGRGVGQTGHMGGHGVGGFGGGGIGSEFPGHNPMR